MTEDERKAQLTDLTGGLRCRCPGNQELTRVECRGIGGVRYCYFACADPGSPVETRYPVGEPGLCRCSLGTQLDGDLVRGVEHEGDRWGFAACRPVQVTELLEEEERVVLGNPALLWPVAIGVGALFWYITTRGN